LVNPAQVLVRQWPAIRHRNTPQHVLDTLRIVDRSAGLLLDPADLADDFSALVQQRDDPGIQRVDLRAAIGQRAIALGNQSDGEPGCKDQYDEPLTHDSPLIDHVPASSAALRSGSKA